MRIGISALLCNMEKALKICRENKMINHIEIGIDSIDDCRQLRKYVPDFEEISHMKGENLSIGIHLPMELNPCEDIDYIRDSWAKLIKKFSEEMDFLQISYYNMHLGYVMSNKLEKNRDRYLDNAVEFFKKILGENKDLHLTIENTYTKGGDLSNVGSRVEDFQYVFEQLKKIKMASMLNNLNPLNPKYPKVFDNNISFCYDSGHDLICKSDYYLLHDKIKVIHLSDNNGVDDQHIGIKKGCLRDRDLKKILMMEAEFLVLEMELDAVEESLLVLKKLQ